MVVCCPRLWLEVDCSTCSFLYSRWSPGFAEIGKRTGGGITLMTEVSETPGMLQYLLSHQLKTGASEFAYKFADWISGHSADFPACREELKCERCSCVVNLEKMNRSYLSAASKNLMLFAVFITNGLFSQSSLDVISAIAEFLQRYLVVFAVVENWRFKGNVMVLFQLQEYWLIRKAIILPLALYLYFPAWGVMLPSVLSFKLCLYSSSLPILFSLILFIKVYVATVALTVNENRVALPQEIAQIYISSIKQYKRTQPILGWAKLSEMSLRELKLHRRIYFWMTCLA